MHEIVKVQRALISSAASPPALIYAQHHRNLRHVPMDELPAAVLAALEAFPKVYWYAEWTAGGWRRWGEQAPAQDW